MFFQDRLIVLLGGRDRTVEMGFKKLGFFGFYKKKTKNFRIPNFIFRCFKKNLLKNPNFNSQSQQKIVAFQSN